MNLADLAESTLALIFEYEGSDGSSTAMFTAWLTGNRKLMSKIVNGGVERVNIQNPNRGAIIKLPKCIKQWKLAHLAIHAPSCTFEPHVSLSTEVLLRWRNSLRHLELSFKDSVDLLFDSQHPASTNELHSLFATSTRNASSDAPASSDLGICRHRASETSFEETPSKRRKLSEDAAQYDLHTLSISNDNTSAPSAASSVSIASQRDVPVTLIGNALPPVFPYLQSLKLCIHKLCDTDRLFRLLPPTLISLTLDWDEFNFFIPSFSSLPPHLKHLLLPSYKSVFNEHNLKTVPQPNEIESFTGDMNEKAYTLLVRDWETLFPNLDIFPSKRRLNWFSELGFDKEGAIGEALPKYPSPLRSLNIGDESRVNYNIPLPARLTSLHCKRCPTQFMASWLPSSLTTMVVSKLDWNQIESTDWPSSLTSLTCLRDTELPFSIAPRLPRNIKQLSPKTFGNQEEAAKFNVEEARSVGRQMILENDVDRRLWSTAKQELLERASNDKLREKEITERYIEAIESGGLFGLPLMLASMDITSVFPVAVPPKLEDLTVRVEDDKLLKMHLPNPPQFYDLIPPTTILRVHMSPQEALQ